jgi:hypothetical protein
MKYENIIKQAMLAVIIPTVIAYPGGKMMKTLAEIKIKARGLSPITGPEDSSEMIGDLVTPGPTTTIGKVSIQYIIIKTT